MVLSSSIEKITREIKKSKKLPYVKLIKDLKMNPNTVREVVQILEKDGKIEGFYVEDKKTKRKRLMIKWLK